MVKKSVFYHHDERDLKLLLQNCSYLETSSLKEISKAYFLAKEMHEGQKREGGEPYMIHPFMVALYATCLGLSAPVIMACLLHDTVEDTALTLEQIEGYFGVEVASYVDGVTKLKGFSSREEKQAHNTSKLFRSFIHFAPEVFFIKLLDRVHNMTTIEQKKKREKQIENAKETLDIFVPMAKNLGCGVIQYVLEDRSFHCLDAQKYSEIAKLRENLLQKTLPHHKQVMGEIEKALLSKDIQSQIYFRLKNIYAISQKEKEGFSYDQIHDLYSIKVGVKQIADCYASLEKIHQIITPIHYRMKDYIASPKTTGYQAFHTTGNDKTGMQYQVQIKTFDMIEYARKGICVYSLKQNPSMKQALEQLQFYKTLQVLDELIPDDMEFYQALQDQILTRNIYITLMDGSEQELPKNSTIWDLLCKLGEDELVHFKEATRDGEFVSPSTILQDKDEIAVSFWPKKTLPPKQALNNCKTPLAKKMIASYYTKPTKNKSYSS